MRTFNEQINRFIVYIVLSISFIAIFTFVELLWDFLIGKFNLISHLLVVLFLLLFYPKAKKLVQTFVDKNFYRRWYKIRQSFRHLNGKISVSMDYEKLLDEIFNGYIKILQAERAILFVLEDKYYIPKRWLGIEKPEIRLNNDDEIIMTFRHRARVIDLKIKRRGDEYWKTRSKLFSTSDGQNGIKRTDFKLIFPIMSEFKMVGFILVGGNLAGYTNTSEIRQLILKTSHKSAIGIRNAQIYLNSKRESMEKTALFEIGKKISSSLNVDEVLNLIIDSLRQVVHYDAGAILLIDPKTKNLKYEVIRGYDVDTLDKIHLKVGVGIVGDVVKTGKAEIISDVRKDARYVVAKEATKSELAVPLIVGEDIIGVFVLENDSIDFFTKRDLKLLQTFAGQAAIAIQNAELYEESLKKKQIESELLVASKVQRALLPSRPPTISGLAISAENIPSQAIGGDFYDLIKFPDNRLGVAIGDVSGKGTPGAILMATLYAAFRSQVKAYFTASEVVAKLNLLLCEITTEGKYATFFYGIYEPETKVFYYTNAGHNPPMLIRAGNTDVELLKTGGIVLGFLPDATFKQTSVKLLSGDIIVFYTDGITEAENNNDEHFGENRLVEIIRKNINSSPADIKNFILDSVKNFSDGVPQQDDITLLVLKVK
jgi:sigma-B regulation protein RsbU (phosphoserine phosphatase)